MVQKMYYQTWFKKLILENSYEKKKMSVFIREL